MIPDRLREDVESTAERRLFERLRHATSDEIVAFHSVAWLVPGEKGRPRQGEADFVLAHPHFGVVTLEVKGGAIRYEAATGRWYSRGTEGENEIKDPVRQARRASFSLRDSLARAKRGAPEIAFGYAVAFPDTRVSRSSLKPDLPRTIVIDHADLRNLDGKLFSIFRYWQGTSGEPALGEQGVRHLERVLANSFELRAPLAFELEEEERELMTLTEQQYRVLDMLARQARAAIGGCAGSGKTFLAAEKARRLARQGFRVLVLCFNTLLAQFLGRGLADAEGIDVFSFDELCLEVVREAGRRFPHHLGEEEKAYAPYESPAASLYYSALHKHFEEFVEVAAGRYGALVVDEGQDFHPDWWLPLQLLLEDPDRSPLYVFFDDNQHIFPVPEGLPAPGAPIELTVNCRNTKRITSVVLEYYKGGTIEALGPEGPPIETRFYSTEEELLAQLDKSVHAWTREAEVDAGSIALLTPKSAERSALWKVERLGGVALTEDPWDERKVLRSSIYRFKGLERLVVGVAELDGAPDKALYVGFSRPKVFLAVFCPKSARRRLPLELAQAA